jgi:peptidoglycan-associated lipoprotein
MCVNLQQQHLSEPRTVPGQYRILHVVSGMVLVSALLGACSETTNGGSNASLLRPLLQNTSHENAATHAVSSMEAISRGLAAVTPPGAPLQDIYYEFDSTELRGDALEILKQNGEWMKTNSNARVEIEGHCDDTGSAEYNLALGAKRAQIAKDFLVSQGVEPNRLVTISYGKEAPACFEHTEECRRKNRRARFVVFTELPTL